MDFLGNDELQLYRGKDYQVSKHITIHQPTLGEICDYGEGLYYSMVYQLTATPQSMKYQLWTVGIDYTEITSWNLFYNFIYSLFSPKFTSILFGDLDFSKFELKPNYENKSLYLEQYIDGDRVVIDEYTYILITDYLRKVHFIEKDERIPMNEMTKEILIEDAKEEYFLNQQKEFHSQLMNLVSAMINSPGFKYDHTTVWDMKINAFMDSVKRISKMQTANVLLQSGYSGFGINLKEVDKKQIDWLGDLQ